MVYILKQLLLNLCFKKSWEKGGRIYENNDLSILLTIEVSDNAIIKELSNNIQIRVKDAIKKSLDVEVKSIDIKVKNMIVPTDETKDA